jgi:hypothetical protein
MSEQDPHGDPTRIDTPAADATMPMPAVPPTQPAAPGGPPPEPPGPGDPTAPPPDRRPWVIIGLLVVILLVGLALLFMMDDEDDDASTSDTTSSTITSSSASSSSSSSASATSSTTTTEPTTTTTTPPTTIDPARCVSSAPDDPDTTAVVVYDAYTVDDRDCASNLMVGSALDDLFAIPGAGGGWEFMGCQDIEDPDPQTLCGFRFEGGSTSFRMNYSDTDGWTVFEVFQTAD